MPKKSSQQLKTAGLFAGIGGFEVGLEKAGHHVELLCESDPAATRILQAHFKDARLERDIRKLKSLGNKVDLVVAGFPCQDLSQVGTAKGLNGHQSTLVSHVFRLLKQKRIRWVLLENVPFMLQLHKGAAIQYITRNFERLGYRWAYRTIDTRAFGLPQRRERVFLLAGHDEDPGARLFHGNFSAEGVFDRDSPPSGFYWTEGNRGLGWAPRAIPTLKGGSALGIPSPPAIWTREGSITTPDIRDAERMQGFKPNWTRAAEDVVRRGARWRLVGNAVTTSVAEWLGDRLALPATKSELVTNVLKPNDSWPAAAFGDSKGRYSVDISSWPVSREFIPIDEFLRYDLKLLSHKASIGFWTRLENSCLRYSSAFAKDLKSHIKRVSKKA